MVRKIGPRLRELAPVGSRNLVPIFLTVPVRGGVGPLDGALHPDLPHRQVRERRHLLRHTVTMEIEKPTGLPNKVCPRLRDSACWRSGEITQPRPSLIREPYTATHVCLSPQGGTE